MAHQLQALEPAPAQTYASLAAPSAGAARTEFRAPPACRLHARVRRRSRVGQPPRQLSTLQGPAPSTTSANAAAAAEKTEAPRADLSPVPMLIPPAKSSRRIPLVEARASR